MHCFRGQPELVMTPSACPESPPINEFIRVARPLLILLICLVHLPYLASYTADVAPFEHPRTLFSIYSRDVLARSAVPLLSVISGYLAFYSFRKYGYGHFLVKKCRAIALPFIAINLLTLGFFLALEAVHPPGVSGALSNFDGAADLPAAILGLNRLPINGPLYFLRDLFLICCCVPIIDRIARRRAVTALVAGGLVYFNFQNPGLIVSLTDQPFTLLYRLDMALFFLLGYGFALQGGRPAQPDRYGAMVALVVYGVILLAVALLLAALQPSPGAYLKFRWSIGALTLCFVPAFMVIFHTLRGSACHRLLSRLSPYSFTLFLTHIMFVHLVISLIQITGSDISLLSDPGFQLIYAALYLGGCVLFAVALRKLWHRVRRAASAGLRRLVSPRGHYRQR